MHNECKLYASGLIAPLLGAVVRHLRRAVTSSLCFVLLGTNLSGCSGGQNHVDLPAPPPPAIGAASADSGASASDAFSTNVDELRGIVNLLDRTPPLNDGDGLRRAFDLLAAAIEGIPGPPQPARTEAANLMRSREFDVWVSLTREDAKAEAVHETLTIAAGALALATEGSSADTTVQKGVERFRRLVGELSASGRLREQRSRVLDALHGAVDVLMEIRAASSVDAGDSDG
jgi:hypothetical protein